MREIVIRPIVKHVKRYYPKIYKLERVKSMLFDGDITEEEYRYIVGGNT